MGAIPNPKTRVLGRDKTGVLGFQNWRVTRKPGAPGLHSLRGNDSFVGETELQNVYLLNDS